MMIQYQILQKDIIAVPPKGEELSNDKASTGVVIDDFSKGLLKAIVSPTILYYYNQQYPLEGRH